MKNAIWVIVGLILFIELFIFHNGSVIFLGIAFALYLWSLRKEEKMYAIIALVFFLLAVMSMFTLQIAVFVLGIYYIYKRWQKEDVVFFGEYKTGEQPYAWHNQAITKLFGHVTIDATNTILPLKPCFISVFQGIGKVTIYVPYDVTCTVVVNQGYGKVCVNGQQMKGEIVLDPGARRQCMIHVSNGMGEVEIWQK